jgi:hypothetical protein
MSILTKNICLTVVITLAVASIAFAEKRKPANADLIPCLNRVNAEFQSRFQPAHTAYKVDGQDMPVQERNELHAEIQKLLKAKSQGIIACQQGKKNVSFAKILKSIK